MAENELEIDIRKRLAEIIQAAVPNALVFPYWVLAEGIGEAAPQFVSTADSEEWGAPHLHAYSIGEDEETREKISTSMYDDNFTLRVWGFYGVKTTEEKNSMDVFSIHRRNIKDALSAATKLQTEDDPNGIPEVRKHGEWQISLIGNFYMGSWKVHVAQGTLTVFTRVQVNMTPTS